MEFVILGLRTLYHGFSFKMNGVARRADLYLIKPSLLHMYTYIMGGGSKSFLFFWFTTEQFSISQGKFGRIQMED